MLSEAEKLRPRVNLDSPFQKLRDSTLPFRLNPVESRSEHFMPLDRFSQHSELSLIKICALADSYHAVREAAEKRGGNPIRSGRVEEAAEEYRFPPKIWLVQTALALTITMVSPGQAKLTNDRSTP